MRLAILVIGLGVSFLFGSQSLIGVGLMSMSDAVASDGVTLERTIAGVGVVAALIGFAASALVFASAFVAGLGLAVAGVTGVALGVDYPDAAFWGWCYLALAGLAFLAGVARYRRRRRFASLRRA